MLETPLLFLNYNRPDLTRQVLEAIRAAQPKSLFLAVDGPKSGKPGDREKCQEVRNILRDGVDWDCNVHTLLREENLGCKASVSSAITWFFDHVEEGIILEDDTVPSPGFFQFCSELLERFREDEKVIQIGGNNFQLGRRQSHSYYFSIYVEIWGWATWRRAWKLYDVDMKSFPELRKDDSWQTVFSGQAEKDFWMNTWQSAWEGKIDTWDFQWTYTAFSHQKLCVLPNVNLVTNLGFGGDATHTSTDNSWLAEFPVGELGQLDHPAAVAADRKADAFSFRYIFQNKPLPLLSRLALAKNRLRKTIRRYRENRAARFENKQHSESS